VTNNSHERKGINNFLLSLPVSHLVQKSHITFLDKSMCTKCLGHRPTQTYVLHR